MKRAFPFSMIAATALTLALSPAYRAVADDETQDTEIKVRATLDATSCDATPPTITVLGLTIDVSTASIEAPDAAPTPGSGEESVSHKGGGGRGGNDPAPGGCYYCAPSPTPTPVAPVAASAPVTGCAALVVGKSVEVRLASDSTPLVATDVQQKGATEETEIKAPVQNADAIARTITLLGLAIDIGGAGLDGSDDSDQNSQPIDGSQLMMGQFVEAKLASSTPPLVATELEVKNFSNQLQVTVEDRRGHEISDVDDNGDPVDDVTVDVDEVVAVQPAATGSVAGATPTHIRKRLHFRSGSNGSVTLSGLPTGVGNVVVTRSSGGTTSTGRRLIRIRGNSTRQLHIRLRPAHR